MLRILHQFILTAVFAVFASQASAMFIQPDWLDPTQPGVGTNRYAYSNNDPINNYDRNGNFFSGLRDLFRSDDQISESARNEIDRINEDIDDQVGRYEQGDIDAAGLMGILHEKEDELAYELGRLQRAGKPGQKALIAALESLGVAASGSGKMVGGLVKNSAAVSRLPPDIGRKLEFFLGNATGKAHNVQRSQVMQGQLSKIGIYDDVAGRTILREHLETVGRSNDFVVGATSPTRVVKESFLRGPGGSLSFETIWDGNRLITGVLRTPN